MHSIPQSSTTAALILAGGRSRRLRSLPDLPDGGKPFLTFNGRTLLEEAGFQLSPLAGSILVMLGDEGASVRVPRQIGAASITTASDREPGGGPLLALRDGLGRLTADPRITTILVAAADMPWISGTAAGFLIERLQRSSPNTLWVLPMAAGRPQVLFSAIRPLLLPRIEAFIEAGGSSISRFLESLQGLQPNPAEVIPEAAWRAIDPDLRSVSDVDTPEDLATLRREQAVRWPASGPCSQGSDESFDPS